ncbi:hypothetical protein A3L23_01096 [Rhodococcoides fascians D188]|nr:hypothetical protein A3L23_01096 [Rhodococcus fascians D188]
MPASPVRTHPPRVDQVVAGDAPLLPATELLATAEYPAGTDPAPY